MTQLVVYKSARYFKRNVVRVVHQKQISCVVWPSLGYLFGRNQLRWSRQQAKRRGIEMKDFTAWHILKFYQTIKENLHTSKSRSLGSSGLNVCRCLLAVRTNKAGSGRLESGCRRSQGSAMISSTMLGADLKILSFAPFLTCNLIHN